MNHDTLNMMVKFICSARKLTGSLEANRLASDAEYRDIVFNKVEAEGDKELYEMLIELRDKLALNEAVSSSNAFKNAGVDFDYYYNSARS
jgi:hypothetical protein